MRVDEEFQQFWRAYPRKVAIADARLAWQKTRGRRPSLPDLISAIQRAAAWHQHLESSRKFVPPWPYPATWLNGERWADEFDMPLSAPTAAPAAPTEQQLAERRVVELARSAWIEIRTAVLRKQHKPLLGWGHPAADAALQAIGGLDALVKHPSRMSGLEAEFIRFIVEGLQDPGENVVQLRRRA